MTFTVAVLPPQPHFAQRIFKALRLHSRARARSAHSSSLTEKASPAQYFYHSKYSLSFKHTRRRAGALLAVFTLQHSTARYHTSSAGTRLSLTNANGTTTRPAPVSNNKAATTDRRGCQISMPKIRFISSFRPSSPTRLASASRSAFFWWSKKSRSECCFASSSTSCALIGTP